MKKQITFALMLLISTTTFSQIKYEKGYFISNNDTKTECLIKNMDWKSNPTSFNYMISDNDLSRAKNLNSVKEFGIYDQSKFIRKNVQIDISPTATNELNNYRSPKWSSQTVFLKVLSQGSATLFQHSKGNNLKFFYSTSTNLEVNQLIFKEYLTSNREVAKNLTYINQLYKEVNCEKKEINQIRKVEYKQSSLTKYFEAHNLCENPDLETTIVSERKKGFINLKITPGINFSSFSMFNTLDRNKNVYDFDSKFYFRIGAEFEYVFPFNKNKWSIFIDPYYFSYTNSIEKVLKDDFVIIERNIKADLTLKRLVVPVGIRHYFFLNDDLKLFINAGLSYDNDIDSSVDFDNRNDLELDSSLFDLFGGVGINVKNKYGAEIRYFSPDYLSADYLYWESSFNTISFIFSYNFL